MAVPWLRSLVADLSPRRPGFAPVSIHVGFVVGKLAEEDIKKAYTKEGKN
jgi:hypothetical protein